MFVRVQAEALQSKNSPGSQFAAVALCPQSARPCCSCRGGRAGNARVDRRAQRPQAAAGHCAGVRDAMRPPFGCYNVQVMMLFGLGVSKRGREWQGTRGTGRGARRGDERLTKRAVLNPPLPSPSSAPEPGGLASHREMVLLRWQPAPWRPQRCGGPWCTPERSRGKVRAFGVAVSRCDEGDRRALQRRFLEAQGVCTQCALRITPRSHRTQPLSSPRDKRVSHRTQPFLRLDLPPPRRPLPKIARAAPYPLRRFPVLSCPEVSLVAGASVGGAQLGPVRR